MVWSDISEDFVEELPISQGYSVIMVVVDRFTKHIHFIFLSHPYTGSKIAHAFMGNISKLHGMSTFIVTNCNPTFTSNFLNKLFKLQGSSLQLNLAYHP